MWLLTDFPRERVQKKYGFVPSEAWLKHVQLSSVRIAAGCSGALVSDRGLVVTNHHCVPDCIGEQSSLQRDLNRTGFLAPTMAQEARCSGTEINQLVEITDVTDQIQAAIAGAPEQQFSASLNAAISRIEKACADSTKLRCDVVSLYHGGRYHLYKYKRYDDVRLVFAPELNASRFGGDPDNFSYPRYALDVTFLRIYENGQPLKSTEHFTVNPRGPSEGELVFAAGHPGATQRLLTVAQLEFLRDVHYPEQLLYLSELRGRVTQWSRQSPEQHRQAADPLYEIENMLKAMGGEYSMLRSRDFFIAKRASEEALRSRVSQKPELQRKYGAAWDTLAKVQDEHRKIYRLYQLIEKGQAFNSNLFNEARTLLRGGDERLKPSEQRLKEFRDSALPSLAQQVEQRTPLYPMLEELKLSFGLTKLREVLGSDHPLVKRLFGQYSPEEIAHNLIANTRLGDAAVRKQLWAGGAKAVAASSDPMIKFARAVDADARAVRKRFEDEIESIETRATELVAQALFAVQGTSIYPDATFSLRLTYGTVKGYRDAFGEVPAMTKLRGAFERHTGREPFVLPQSWLLAKQRLKLDTPLNFVSTLDIIGGNSGSPALNKDGEVIGVLFDGNVQSLGCAFLYDDTANRAVAVHTGGLLEALRTIYGATALANELAPPVAAKAQRLGQ
ncbi:MAG: S46 family peptidase [Polyangia bacterium]